MQNTVLSGTINNAIITLGNIDDSGKGRHFVSRFIKDGLVKIEGHGVVLLKKETLDASLPSMIGTPVIIKHQDVTKKNADKLRCGTISNAYFNEPDGWYYCEGIIWDEDAQELIENQGWSVSCSYDFLSYNDEGGVENNIPYDKEFTQLNFTHLAIVDNPRYERANIVFNSKDEEKGKWVTIKGNHIFIPDGKTLDEVIEEKGWGDKEKGKSEPKKESNTTKDTRKHIDRIEKLIKKYNLEPHEEDELLDELGSFEAKLDENLEPREEEELREELFDFEDDIKRHQEMKKQEKSEPEWLQREKQKLDRQTTQMYEDRYSTEHPETYKKNLEEAKDKQNPDDELVTVQKADTHKLEVRLNDLKSRYNEVMKYYWEADEDDRDIHQYKADAIQDEMIRIQDRLDELKKNKTDNSKEQDMALLEEIKKLISKVENSKENDMEIDEKIENETVDKRKLIDEVAGIMKSAGCDDEVIRTAIGKMEKIGYDKSEAGSADNKKVKNEEPDKKDDKKVENEDEKDKKEVKDLKDDMKKDVDNKCKNSKEESTFDKINAIYNSIKLVKEESKYTSRQEKLDAAKEYFS